MRHPPSALHRDISHAVEVGLGSSRVSHMFAGCPCRYDRFTFDITSALQNGSSGSVHELLVEVTDPSGDHTTFCTTTLSTIQVLCAFLNMSGMVTVNNSRTSTKNDVCHVSCSPSHHTLLVNSRRLIRFDPFVDLHRLVTLHLSYTTWHNLLPCSVCTGSSVMPVHSCQAGLDCSMHWAAKT